jgi:hypothetical protein
VPNLSPVIGVTGQVGVFDVMLSLVSGLGFDQSLLLLLFLLVALFSLFPIDLFYDYSHVFSISIFFFPYFITFFVLFFFFTLLVSCALSYVSTYLFTFM